MSLAGRVPCIALNFFLNAKIMEHVEDMSLTQAAMRARIFLAIVEKISGSAESRQEALVEYVLATAPQMDEPTARRLAGRVPDLLPELYARWIDAFSARLFETVPEAQVQHLCDGSEANNAALRLVFLMFMESERMEQQVQKDMAAYMGEPVEGSEVCALAAAYLRQTMNALRPDTAAVPGEKA